MGSCKYAPEKSAVIWTIKQFPGGKEFFMKAHFNLPSVQAEDAEARPPIQVNFEIPYFTTSGIQVDTETVLCLSVSVSISISPARLPFVFLCDTRMQVRYLKIIEKSGYQALPWVRYITTNGGNASRTRVQALTRPRLPDPHLVSTCHPAVPPPNSSIGHLASALHACSINQICIRLKQ